MDFNSKSIQSLCFTDNVTANQLRRKQNYAIIHQNTQTVVNTAQGHVINSRTMGTLIKKIIGIGLEWEVFLDFLTLF